MRIFVTGATGFVGEAVVRDLLQSGYEVVGLGRSEEAAKALKNLGAEFRRGELSDTASLAEGARDSDGVIHTAFINDFSRYEEVAAIDQRAIEAMADSLKGSGKGLIVTSVTVLLTSGQLGRETDPLMSNNPVGYRARSEASIKAAAQNGVRASVVRLPPSVHGLGDHGLVPALIDVARLKGFAAYIQGGANRWPAVHREDAARLYRLALEKAQAGSVFHAVGEEGVSMHDIAATIGRGLSVPVRDLSQAEAVDHFGPLARFIHLDNPTSSALTREELGWDPQGYSLLKDMRESNYFPLAPPR